MNKKIILIILITISIASAEEFSFEDFKNVPDISQHPLMQERLKNIYPQMTDDEREIMNKVPFIVGGQRANLNQFPHQVIMFIYTSNGLYSCGGSLIKNQWVLTAAHCVDMGPRAVTIGAGGVDLNRPWEMVVNVTNSNHIYIHPDYNEFLNNDLALIFMDKAPKNLSDVPNADVVKLASKNQITTGLNGILSGFGYVSDNRTSSDYLLYATLPIVDNSVCESVYGTKAVKSTNICLRATNTTSSCSGDSGGPLIITENNQQVLVGVVSFGAQAGCELGYPNGMTRVSSYLDWIQKVSASPKTIVVNFFLFFISQFVIFAKLFN